MPYKDPEKRKEWGIRYYAAHREQKLAREHSQVLACNAVVHAEFADKIHKEGLPIAISVPPDFGYWFTGLFDGEGCLIGNKNAKGSLHLGVVITLRVDDLPMLKYVQTVLGGVLRSNTPPPPSSPKVAWFLTGGIKTLVSVAIPLFDTYPLHSKKRLEYILWRRLVIMYYIATLGGNNPKHITRLPDRAGFDAEANRLCNEIHAIRFPTGLVPFKCDDRLRKRKGQTNE